MHVFVDDGISGAEFANRPGFVRLMAALKPRPPFQVLIMSEESRLGREAIETAYALKQLIQAGVRVCFYLEDRERTFDSPTDKLLMSVTAFADELERQKAGCACTTRCGGRRGRSRHGRAVFGYDNLEVLDARASGRTSSGGSTSAEAAVVRRIFELCAAGAGLTRIAKALNADGVPAPRPQQGRPAGWAPSSVRVGAAPRRCIAARSSGTRAASGTAGASSHQHARPEAEWLRRAGAAPADRRRRALGARRTRARESRAPTCATRTGSRGAHPARGTSRSICSSGSAAVRSAAAAVACAQPRHGKPRAVLRLHGDHKRGRDVCSQPARLPHGGIDAEVLATSARTAPADRDRAAIALALERVERRRHGSSDGRGSMRELAKVDTENARDSRRRIGAGRATRRPLVGRLQAWRRAQTLCARNWRGACGGVRRSTAARSSGDSSAKLADWRGLLTRNVAQGRRRAASCCSTVRSGSRRCRGTAPRLPVRRARSRSIG